MSNHTIIYVMRHIDIGGHIEIPYKKVGITGSGNATLTSRLEQISSTKSPIKAQCIAAWEHEDARAIENALHLLLEDSRVEGEWFLDKNDTLVERMQPIMELIGAKELEIPGAEDSYTKSVLRKEDESKKDAHHSLLGEISGQLKEPLRTDIRKAGPTLFSDKTNLTYYVNSRKGGEHRVGIGRSKNIFDELSAFLEAKNYDVEQDSKGYVELFGLAPDQIAELINVTEAEFIVEE
jgi:hypothetical protein